MKHIKQRKNECYLNTLAMLTDKPVDEILAAGKALSPYTHSWDSFTSNDPIDNVCLTFAALARKFAPWLYEDIKKPVASLDLNTKGFFNLLSDDYVEEVSEGRGAVLMACPNPFCAHICAFEDGMIYDSALSKPIDAYAHYVSWGSRGMLPYKIVRQK